MSSHVRQQIRDEVLERIKALGLNPSWNWSKPLDEVDMPAGAVLTEDETSEVVTTSGTLSRELDLTIVVVIHGDPDRMADDLDGYAARIETELGSSPPLLTKRFELTSTAIELMSDEDGARWYGLLMLGFQAVYYTKRGAPTQSA